MKQTITIDVRLDAKTFRRYCAFDALRRQRRWYWPLLIAMLLITASLAGVFGWVPMSETGSGLLMGLGIAMLMLNIGLFCISVEVQIASQSLKNMPLVYSLRFDDAGVLIRNGQKEEPPVDVSWDRLWAAFQNGSDIYLYVNPGRALILPDGQASVKSDALWAYIRTHLGAEKCFENRKRAV